MFRDLARNLYAGARLCFMLPVDRADFRASLDQAFALLVFGSGTILLIEFAAASGNWFPSPDRVGLYALAILTGLIGCFAATRLLGVAERLSTVVVMLLAGAFWLIPVFGPVFALAGEAALAPSSAAGATVAILIVLWCLGIAMRVIQIAAGGGIVKPAVAASILVVFTALPKLLLIPPGTWLGEPAKLPPSWTQENLYYGQFGMVNQAADWLAKGRPGVSDIYFVGFAADAREPVFLNEMRGVTRLFDRRFDTRTRSVVLINNRSTVRQAPLANMHNLGRILSMIGKRIDPEEDIVVLYLSAPALAGGGDQAKLRDPRLRPDPCRAYPGHVRRRRNQMARHHPLRLRHRRLRRAAARSDHAGDRRGRRRRPRPGLPRRCGLHRLRQGLLRRSAARHLLAARRLRARAHIARRGRQEQPARTVRTGYRDGRPDRRQARRRRRRPESAQRDRRVAASADRAESQAAEDDTALKDGPRPLDARHGAHI